MADTVRRVVRIVGVPMDYGQKRRGVDMGPSALRYAGLQQRLRDLGLTVIDSGNIAVPVVEEIAGNAEDEPYQGRARHATVIGAVARQVYASALESLRRDEAIIFLGGDHSVSFGTAPALARHVGKVGVLWVDAHGDFNTPDTTHTGNVHGMVVAGLVHRGAPELWVDDTPIGEQRIAMIGVRDLDNDERDALRDSGIAVLTMREVDEHGIAQVVRLALAALGDVEAIHVSFDMDSLDPREAPGVGTPVPGGLSYREAHLLMEMLADDGRVRSLDLVEVNPILDTENRTARLAVELATGLFGKRII